MTLNSFKNFDKELYRLFSRESQVFERHGHFQYLLDRELNSGSRKRGSIME